MYEYGLFKKIRSDWFPVIQQENANSIQSIDLGQIHSPIFILLGGWIVAVSIFAVEKYIWRLEKASSKIQKFRQRKN